MGAKDLWDHGPGPAGDRAVRVPGGVLDLLHASAVVTDAQGRIVLWSPEAEQLFGYDAAEALGRSMADLLALPEDVQRIRELFRQARVGTSFAGVFLARNKDGSTRSVEYRKGRLHDPDGNVLGLTLAADVDTVRRVESDLALSELLINQSPVGLAVFDTELRWMRINDALTTANGVTEEEVVGRRLEDTLPGVDTQAIESAMRRVLRTGEPILDHRTIGRVPADPDHDHAWSESYYRIEDRRGKVLGVAVSVVDVTARHLAAAEIAAAHRHLATLSEASADIGSTLDLRQTARELAEAVVPRFADLATVDLLESVATGRRTAPGDQARFGTVAVAPADPDDDMGGATLWEDLDTEEPAPMMRRSVREGTPAMIPRVDSATLRRIAGDEQAVAALRKAGVRSCLVAPLVARGTVLGVLSLYRTGNTRPFDSRDLQMVCEIVGRAAISVDNALLYGRERDTALTLQRSLLPQTPPDQPEGLEIAAGYRPAGSGTEVGGDWYDVLPLSDGKVGLVVGDVMGSGVRAAAIMGQLRTTTRALARLDLPPAELLGHLDETAATLSESFATCVYAVCDPRRGTCTFSSAGHLPPVLVQPGRKATLLTVPTAAPLGVGGVPFGTLEVKLPEGCLLALYTDGLVETRYDAIDVGLHTLCRTLERATGSLGQTCDMLLDTVDHTSADDVALLLARFAGA
ncbi:PAS domain S-box protein [Streptomyces seoulensis]|uniref:protein-serine/threonine phosphatase n=1 Tax=Streptomyces seoulensis TaxID=73044 RepID=A0A4P6TP41_STRSO|nr:SpoIIE family protein phosphatase [Streptomyces seoulensis]QBJ89029.1 PAS domain S-box protein [Streptomyces seoulensis]